jgi:hypothetical protein
MIDLTKPWPLGLSRRNWPIFLVAVLVILAALAVIDESAGQLAGRKPGARRFSSSPITGFPNGYLSPAL